MQDLLHSSPEGQHLWTLRKPGNVAFVLLGQCARLYLPLFLSDWHTIQQVDLPPLLEVTRLHSTETSV